jgi:preprotein translocase subunit SecG
MLHLLISAALVIVILLQSGRGGGLAGAFGGGGGSQTIFGGRGAATFLSKSTAILGAAFMLSSLTLAMVSTRTPAKTQRSVIEDVIRKEQAEQPRPSTRGPEQAPGVGGQTQQQAPTQTQPGGQTGQKPTPGAGVVPSEVLPPAKSTTGQTQQKSQSQTQPPASEQNPSQTGKQGTGGK